MKLKTTKMKEQNPEATAIDQSCITKTHFTHSYIIKKFMEILIELHLRNTKKRQGFILRERKSQTSWYKGKDEN